MDNVRKNEKVYTVKECNDHWNVSTVIGKLSVSYQIPKDVCATFEALKQYIESENMF